MITPDRSPARFSLFPIDFLQVQFFLNPILDVTRTRAHAVHARSEIPWLKWICMLQIVIDMQRPVVFLK
jgi:hypothetical protein